MEQCLQMRYSGDWLFWFYMAMQGDIIERYEVLNYFRQHTQKVTVKAENNGGGKSEDIEIVRIMEQHLTHLSRYKRCIRRGNALQPHCQTKHNRASKTAIMGTPPAEIKRNAERRTSGAPQPDSTAILSFCSDYEKRPPYSFPKIE